MCIADGSINFLLNSEKVTFNVFNLLLNELTPPHPVIKIHLSYIYR